jgi:hypothetical protein
MEKFNCYFVKPDGEMLPCTTWQKNGVYKAMSFFARIPQSIYHHIDPIYNYKVDFNSPVKPENREYGVWDFTYMEPGTDKIKGTLRITPSWMSPEECTYIVDKNGYPCDPAQKEHLGVAFNGMILKPRDKEYKSTDSTGRTLYLEHPRREKDQWVIPAKTDPSAGQKEREFKVKYPPKAFKTYRKKGFRVSDNVYPITYDEATKIMGLESVVNQMKEDSDSWMNSEKLINKEYADRMNHTVEVIGVKPKSEDSWIVYIQMTTSEYPDRKFSLAINMSTGVYPITYDEATKIMGLGSVVDQMKKDSDSWTRMKKLVNKEYDDTMRHHVKVIGVKPEPQPSSITHIIMTVSGHPNKYFVLGINTEYVDEMPQMCIPQHHPKPK